MNRIAIFASGSGSNFEALTIACQTGEINAEVALCVVDKRNAGVIERANRLGVPVMLAIPSEFISKRDFEKAIADRLDSEGIDLVCLAGYMRIIGPELLGRYEGKIINIHPSLLPAFKGAHAIRDAFDYGVKVFGVTIHYVDESLDGGKIISQAPVPYTGSDIDELETMIHRTEHRLYVDTVNEILK